MTWHGKSDEQQSTIHAGVFSAGSPLKRSEPLNRYGWTRSEPQTLSGRVSRATAALFK
jgi:hypothetical protein